MEFRLVADSCCEAVPELWEGIDFRRVPLTMTLGSDTYTDDEALNPLVFLRRLKEFKGRAMSACPSPASYAEAYAQDKPSFVVTLSSQLSGSYSAALVGAELGQGSVCVVDSKSASAGELLAALRVREIAGRAADLESARREIEEEVRKIRTFFVLENLENLAKSGRMNRIAARLASVMQIRPILGSDGEGNISLFAKVQGTKNAVLKLCALIGENCADTTGRTLVIAHCNNPGQAERLRQLAEERYRFERIILTKTGGVSTLYADQGGIIIAF